MLGDGEREHRAEPGKGEDLFYYYGAYERGGQFYAGYGYYGYAGVSDPVGEHCLGFALSEGARLGQVVGLQYV